MKSFATALRRFLPRLASDEEAERARKHAVFAQMTAENEGKLLRLARRLCSGNEDKAQDLVQDTLIRGYQAYTEGKFQEGTNAGAWLMRILTNNFLMDYRRQKHLADIDLDSVVTEGKILPESLRASKGDRPDTALLTRTLDEDLERALATLSPTMRLCVVLVDIEELSYIEAARILSVPVGTVRSRLFRAHEKLAAILQTNAEQRRLP